MSNLREYIISLYKHEDLDEFYLDMETLRATQYNCMPDRAVDCFQRRPVSRNTHYMLSEDEAAQIRNDPRVLAVELTPEELGLKIIPHYTQTSAYWNKGTDSTVNSHRNWGLYRSTLAQNITNWGMDFTENTAGTIDITSSGKNVDVVIVDGHMDPTHPEFAVNADGTGGSRVNQFNWFSLDPFVKGTLPGTYTYPTDFNDGDQQRTDDNNHGAHVTGTSCGNTQGWARDATVYNISPYGTNANIISGTNLFDYIKVFHETKAVNPATGFKNPTVCTNSWAYGAGIPITSVTSVVYQGVTYTGPFTKAKLESLGCRIFSTDVIIPSRVISVELDVADLITAGVICVGAAGNDYSYGTDSSADNNYYNSIAATINGIAYTLYYNRGCTPGAAMITVGSLGPNRFEHKSTFSNCGPIVDIFAPGHNIMSSVNTSYPEGYVNTYDSRNDLYFIVKYSGTSMATPQVCGVIACILETYPFLTQSQVLSYLTKYANLNKMGDGGSGDNYSRSNSLLDDTRLQGAPNMILRYKQERPSSGNVFPKSNTWFRPTSGQTWPRPRIFGVGRS